MIDYKKLFWDSLRSYFAPLIGAFSAIKSEIERMDREHSYNTRH
jgi:hypothetical protein